MAAKVKAPVVLGPDYEKRIRQAQRRLTELLPLCDQCESCGIDCQAYRDSIKALQDNLNLFLTHFFPQR